MIDGVECGDVIITIGGWQREEENRAKNAKKSAGLQCSWAERKGEVESRARAEQ